MKNTEEKEKNQKLYPKKIYIFTEQECEKLYDICEYSRYHLEDSFSLKTMLICGCRIGVSVHNGSRRGSIYQKAVVYTTRDGVCPPTNLPFHT